MSPTLSAIVSFSISIPVIVGLVRFRKIDQAYYPFIYALCLGLINELVSFFLIRAGYSNAINTNIYVLVESVLLLLFFKKQNLFRKRKQGLWWVVIFYILLWSFENFYILSIRQFSSYFIATYSFFTVLMSINLINALISAERKMLVRNPSFLICFALILFYTCATLIEVFWIYGLNSSKAFRLQVYEIMAFVNLIVNLIYAIAILWMPGKREYTLL